MVSVSISGQSCLCGVLLGVVSGFQLPSVLSPVSANQLLMNPLPNGWVTHAVSRFKGRIIQNTRFTIEAPFCLCLFPTFSAHAVALLVS